MFMFALSSDLGFTLRRFAITSGFLLIWAWFGLEYFEGWLTLLFVFIPNPWGFWRTLIDIPRGYWGTWALMYPALLLFFQVIHAFAFVSLVRIFWRRYRGSSTPDTRPIDPTRLGQPWFIVPLVMTLSFIILPYFALLPSFASYEGRRFHFGHVNLPHLMVEVSFVVPLIGLSIAAIGVIVGWSRIFGAKRYIAANINMKSLPDDHWLTQRVHNLAKKLELTPPKVEVMAEPNALAVGVSRNQATVVLGIPLIQKLTPAELDAVIGHELGHIISGDMQQMQFAEGYQRGLGNLVGAMGIIITRAMIQTGHIRSRAGADFGFILSNFARFTIFLGAEFAVKGLSRSREFYADAIGAAVSSPEAMASALEKVRTITTAPTPVEEQYACLMFRGAVGRFLATHPPFETRIAALQSRAYLDMLPKRKG